MFLLLRNIWRRLNISKKKNLNAFYQQLILSLSIGDKKKTLLNCGRLIKNRIDFRNYRSIDVIDFSNHLLTNYEHIRVANCTHLINMWSMCVNCKTKIYRKVASSYINQEAPIVIKVITVTELEHYPVIISVTVLYWSYLVMKKFGFQTVLIWLTCHPCV